jgi:hypothetical protein
LSSSLSRDHHYHFGRVLYESRKDLSGAISELDQAVALEPGDARAKYYRGQAIRVLIEQDLLVKARDDLRNHLDARVPVTRHRDIEQFTMCTQV